MKIFAYGSNLSAERLHRRVPSAEFIGRARLAGYYLRFHKRSNDGSGKANAFWTGSEDDCVWGVVFECPEDEKPALDDAEGLGHGYEETFVAVVMDDGSSEPVRAYIALSAAIEDSLEPYTWYHAYVCQGAQEQGLPAEYVEALKQQSASRDPDSQRETRNTRVRL